MFLFLMHCQVSLKQTYQTLSLGETLIACYSAWPALYMWLPKEVHKQVSVVGVAFVDRQFCFVFKFYGTEKCFQIVENEKRLTLEYKV